MTRTGAWLRGSPRKSKYLGTNYCIEETTSLPTSQTCNSISESLVSFTFSHFFASFRFLRALVSHVRTAHQLALGNAGPHCCCDTSRPEHTYCSQCGLPHPRRRANMRAQAFMPPFDLINSVRRILPGLAFRAYRKARDHLLLLLASATSRSAVQKITMPNGSGLIRGASA